MHAAYFVHLILLDFTALMFCEGRELLDLLFWNFSILLLIPVFLVEIYTRHPITEKKSSKHDCS